MFIPDVVWSCPSIWVLIFQDDEEIELRKIVLKHPEPESGCLHFSYFNLFLF